MTYRIELTNGKTRNDYNEYAYGSAEVKTFLNDCVPNGFRVVKIVKVYKDGRGCNVTKKFI